MLSKSIIVTGASKGFGKAISQKLIAEGAYIYGIGRKFDWDHLSLKQICMDLADLANLEINLKEIQIDSLDAIVCNAGKGKFGFLEQFSLAQIRELVDLNFVSQVGLIKAFLPLMKKQKKGDIIVIGSEAGLIGKKQGSIYAATKFALRGFCQALREECASSHIRVSLINPGMAQTSFFEGLKFSPGSDPLEYLLPNDVAETVSLILNARAGTVFDEINLSPQKKNIHFKKVDQRIH